MKTRYLLTVNLLLLALGCFSQQRVTSQSLDSLRASFIVDADEMVGEFEAYAREAEQEYHRYVKQMEADYQHYVRKVSKVWGTDSLGQIVEDSRREWVEYGQHYKSRSRVNFETGRVLVEVALDPADAKDSLKQTERLAEAVEQLLESRGSSCPYESRHDRNEPLTTHPVLQGLLDISSYQGLDESQFTAPDSVATVLVNSRPTPPQPTVRGRELPVVTADEARAAANQGEPIAGEDKADTLDRGTLAAQRSRHLASRQAAREEASRRAAERAAARSGRSTTRSGHSLAESRSGSKKGSGKSMASRIIAEQSAKQVSSVTGSDGEVRQVVAIEMKLVTDNLSKNAALYKDLVAEFSNRYQVEQPLIYAIIEQESYFNPEAASWVPAYGLMQLVPTSGGRHAYRYVYGKDWCPTRSYLFNPRNNIELGTAYLRVLLNQFAAVGNADCRRLCAIASYNTGAGNVSRAFTGGTSVVQATPHINRMDYNGLYTHLVSNLPYSETRNYVAGVTRRMAKYVKQE